MSSGVLQLRSPPCPCFNARTPESAWVRSWSEIAFGQESDGHSPTAGPGVGVHSGIMQNRSDEVAALALADEHLRRAEGAIQSQTHVLDMLKESGHDTQAAEKLLAEMQHALVAMQHHRALIVQAIQDIDAGRL